MTPEQAARFLEENHVKLVLAQFVDIHGVAKTKAVPVGHFQDILGDGAGFAGFAVWGLGQEPHDPDYMAVGDLSTLSLMPWQPGYARIVCNGRVKQQPWPFDTRHILQQQTARLAARGWIMNTGLEPEFMLLVKRADGSLAPADDSDRLDKPCYDYKGLSRSRAFLEALVDSLIQVGVDVYQIDHEDANGQFEINFTYADALTSADRMILFRMAAGEIAHSFGAICSFMPKPLSNRTGSGMHMHISLADKQSRQNVFMDPTDARGLGLSKLAYHFLGGLLAHAPALAALAAPSVNSYKRLVVGRSLSGATWAPAFISYGDNNRTSMVRVPYGRLELRLTDSSANPYLASAAAIAAGLDGIERQLDPGEPQNFNHYLVPAEELDDRGIRVLPQSLREALVALEADPLFAECLGREFIREFIRLKRMEWVEYQRHVSDWEVDRYLEFYDPSEREMCGIIGLLIKRDADRSELGRLMVPMFDCMAERGPDSAGLAVFGDVASDSLRLFSLFVPDKAFDWQALLTDFCQQTGATGRILPRENHATLVSGVDPQRFKAWLDERDPSPHLLSVGRQIEVYKDTGHPSQIARRYGFAEFGGTHCVGHTRMATESAVSPAHAHPFTAGEDFCLVHNGSLSNPYMLRRKLEAEGLHFETDNDTEAACRFIEWRLQQGQDLDQALHTALEELDGFFTLLIATAGQMTLVRDAFACKPAVVAETDAYVAISSEFRSLAHLPGVAEANIFEPLPEVIYSWKV